MNNFLIVANANSMKKCVWFLLSFIFCLGFTFALTPVFVNVSFAEELNWEQTGEELAEPTNNMPKTDYSKPKASLLAIVIDDFGGYERGGVDDLLNSNIPITCAIIPFVDNTESDYNRALQSGKEIILHMPMEAYVKLPENWYGKVYIKNDDSPEVAVQKLEECLATMPDVKGFNIHIGSGACQNQELMQSLYEYANNKGIFFLDSRTVMQNKCEEACSLANSIYLGRDVFLEPEHNRSHAGVTERLNEAVAIAQEKGYAIIIGHVGPEGGINTARAIIDFASKAKDKNIEIVPLSKVYELIKEKQFA